MPEPAGWLALGLAAIIASSIGGVAGFGTGAMMIPVIAWTLGAKATVPVLTIGMFIGNGARVWFSRHEIDYRVVGAYLLGAIPTGIVGAILYSSIEGAWISRLLGGFLLIAVPGRRWLKARGMRVRLSHFPLIGGVFGFLSSLVGAVGPILSPFFLGYGLLRGAYVSTDALCTVGTYFTRGVVFQRYHLLTESTVTVGLYIGVIMIVGAWIGRRLLDRLTERAFLRLIEALLVLCGLQMLLFPPVDPGARVAVELGSMTSPLAPGMSAEIQITVTRELTADALGNPGVLVYATPSVVTLLENTSSAVLKSHLPPGGGSVGTMVEMKHLAATPVGMTVRAKATILETDGKRVLFAVEAWDELEKIAEGRHERFIIGNLARFLERAMAKGRTKT